MIALGRTNTFAYDANGNLISNTGPPVDGFTPQTTYLHNSRGQILQVTDPAGRKHSYTYDSNGDRLTATVDPGGLNLTTQFDYDNVGNLRHKTDPLGRTTTFVYDFMRRRDPTHGSQSAQLRAGNYAYDANGKPTGLIGNRRSVHALADVAIHVFAHRQEQHSDQPIGPCRDQHNTTRTTGCPPSPMPKHHTTQYRYDPWGAVFRVIDARATSARSTAIPRTAKR